MASASSKKTLDTDNITLRTVFARQSDNIPPPFGYILATNGDGKTYWSQPSSLGFFPTFNEFQFDSSSYVGSNPRTLNINTTSNLFQSTVASSTSQLYAKVFQSVDVSGAGSIYAYSNFVLTNQLRFAAQGFMSTTTEPSQMTLMVSSLRDAPALSTNIISYQSLKVLSSLQEPIDTLAFAGNMLYSKTDATSYPILTGFQDFQFRTNAYPTIASLELSSYSATTFLSLSTTIATAFVSSISTVSSLYTEKNIFSTALRSLSTTEGVLFSTNVSTTIGFSNYLATTFNQKFGDTFARATIVQVLDDFGILNTGLSTVSTYKTPVYIMISANKSIVDSYSTPTSISTSTFLNFNTGIIADFTVNGINVISTQLSTLSTAIGTDITSYVNGITSIIPSYLISTTSTFNQLGSLGYLSSKSLASTLDTLGSLGYVSTQSFLSTVIRLSDVYPSTISLGSSLRSTTKVLIDSAPIISSLTLLSSIQSTTSGIINEAANTYISSSGLFDSIKSTSIGIIEYAGFNGYVSSLTLTSTLISTVSSLSKAGFLTTVDTLSSVNSTIQGLPYLTTDNLGSTVNGLSGIGYLSTSALTSSALFFQTYTKQFTSSLILPTNLYRQITTMQPAFAGVQGSNPESSNYYFSSVQFSQLSGFETVLQNARYVTLEYTPCLFFSRRNQIDLTYQESEVGTLSTIVQIQNTIHHDTLYSDTFPLNANITNTYYDTGPSNIYSKKIYMQMSKDTFIQAQTHGLAISHVMERFYFSDICTMQLVYNIEDSVSIFTPRSNAFLISIYN